LENAQLLDAAAVDLLGMITPENLRALQQPDELVAHGQDVVFYYIAEGRNGETSVKLTSGFSCMVTVSR
jgi:hypothetical protein